MAETKNIKYLNKDFSQFRQNLVGFAKTYFPDTYNDFNESDPGMMFIEMAAYVGDVLSFYMDSQLKESLAKYAEEKQNIHSIAYGLGYQPKNYVPAITSLDIYQIVPSKGAGVNTVPDMDYALNIPAGMVVASSEDSSVNFRTIQDVDFAFSSSYDALETTVYQVDTTTNIPTFYLLKKSVKAASGKIETAEYQFGAAKPYDKIILPETNVIDVVDIYDSDTNKWTNVDYLAQESVFDSIKNIAANDPTLYQYNDTTPYLLKLKRTPRRFISRFNEENKLEVVFGAGISAGADEEIIPSPENVGLSLPYGLPGTVNIDPSNFMFTRAYGLAPSDTTLTIRYTLGQGVKENVPSNVLTQITSVEFDIDSSGLDASVLAQCKGSVACTNPVAATGARTRASVDEIRNNTLAYFAAQNRAVTREDYVVRTYSMPPKYGSVAKAFIIQDSQVNPANGTQIPNPLALNLYTLSYDNNKNLTQLNDATKENLKTYLGNYRILTDAINIKNAFVINLGIDFEIITRPNYNNNEVILRCIDRLKNYFNIDKWQINQPIIISDLYTALDKVEGVQTVSNIFVTNKYDASKGYSGNIYNIQNAIKNGILYPSLDPSIFEIKYPNQDIKGKVISL